jgi:flagellar hook-associated protein 2
MPITFSGLASGIDTESLIDQLVNVEKQGARALEARKSNAGRRKAIVADLISKMQAFKTATTAMNTPEEVRAFTATSSDETRVKVTGSGAAQPAQLAIRVSSLARAQTSVSSLFPSTDGTIPMVPGAGQLGIQVGDGEPVVVEFTSLDTLDVVARSINEKVDGAHAEVINTGSGFQLAISSDEGGAANALTFTEGGSSLGFLAAGSVKVTAQDAAFTLNGIPITRTTNTVSDAISGLTFELRSVHAVTDPDTNISVATDPAGVEAKVKSLVDAFNGLADMVSGQLTYNGVARGQDSLFGDSTVRALQRSLSDLASRSYPHGEGEVSLGQLGISLGRDGRLSIDSARLAKAMSEDPKALEHLIAGDAGIAVAVNDLVTQYTRAGDGFLSAKTGSLTREMSDFDLQIERIETRASRVGDQLRAQFKTLESLMSKFQSQQAALASMFG